jgi:hypothetical protein
MLVCFVQPEFWLTGLGAWNDQGKWVGGFDAYKKRFHKIALALNPCGTKPFLSGPGWGECAEPHPVQQF